MSKYAKPTLQYSHQSITLFGQVFLVKVSDFYATGIKARCTAYPNQTDVKNSKYYVPYCTHIWNPVFMKI